MPKKTDGEPHGKRKRSTKPWTVVGRYEARKREGTSEDRAIPVDAACDYWKTFKTLPDALSGLMAEKLFTGPDSEMLYRSSLDPAVHEADMKKRRAALMRIRDAARKDVAADESKENNFAQALAAFNREVSKLLSKKRITPGETLLLEELQSTVIRLFSLYMKPIATMTYNIVSDRETNGSSRGSLWKDGEYKILSRIVSWIEAFGVDALTVPAVLETLATAVEEDRIRAVEIIRNQLREQPDRISFTDGKPAGTQNSPTSKRQRSAKAKADEDAKLAEEVMAESRRHPDPMRPGNMGNVRAAIRSKAEAKRVTPSRIRHAVYDKPKVTR